MSVKKKVVVEGFNSNFELWIPDVESIFKEGGIKVQEFNRVKSFRTGAGLSQEQMAKELGLSTRTYQSKENGSADWKLSEMTKFAEIINEATGRQYSIKDIFLDQNVANCYILKGVTNEYKRKHRAKT